MRSLLLATILTTFWLAACAQAPAEPYQLFSGYFESLTENQLATVNARLHGELLEDRDLIEMDHTLFGSINGVTDAMAEAQLTEYLANSRIIPQYQFALETGRAFTVCLKRNNNRTGMGKPGSWKSDKTALLLFDANGKCLQAIALAGLEQWQFAAEVAVQAKIVRAGAIRDLDGDGHVELLTRKWRTNYPQWGGMPDNNQLQIWAINNGRFEPKQDFALDSIQGHSDKDLKLKFKQATQGAKETTLQLELENEHKLPIEFKHDDLLANYEVTIEFDVPDFGWRTLFAPLQITSNLPAEAWQLAASEERKIQLTIPDPWGWYYDARPPNETLVSNAYHFDWSSNMQLKARVVIKGHSLSRTGQLETGFNGTLKSKPFILYR